MCKYGKHEATIGPYILHVDGPGAGSATDRDDHGFSAWNATAVTVGSVTKGNLNLVGDRDFFKFTVTKTGKYVIYTRGTRNPSELSMTRTMMLWAGPVVMGNWITSG